MQKHNIYDFPYSPSVNSVIDAFKLANLKLEKATNSNFPKTIELSFASAEQTFEELLAFSGGSQAENAILFRFLVEWFVQPDVMDEKKRKRVCDKLLNHI